MSELETSTSPNLFEAIKPDFEDAYKRHIELVARERSTASLNAHALVPTEDFPALKQEYTEHVDHWLDKGIDIVPAIEAALMVNTATEKGLPWYAAFFVKAAHVYKTIEPSDEWIHRWVAEENSHGDIMVRDIDARGIFDMATEWFPTLEKNLLEGIHVEVESLEDTAAYTATQELLTKNAHYNSSLIMDNSAKKNLRKIAADEGRHYRLNVSLLEAISRVSPDSALAAMRRQHDGDNFAMPGEKGIRNFGRLARVMLLAGIFDYVTVLEAQKKTIEDAKLLEAKPKTDQGKIDLEWAHNVVSGDDPRWSEKREEVESIRERAHRRTKPDRALKPFILNHTVRLEGTEYVPIKKPKSNIIKN